MRIAERPVHINEYYVSMVNAYTQKKDDAVAEIEKLSAEIITLRDDVRERYDVYRTHGVNLMEFPEFLNNEYVDGKFHRVATGVLYNKQGDYELVGDFAQLFKLADTQKKIYKLKQSIEFCDKMLSLSSRDYSTIVRYFFSIVHKKLILEGCAYKYGGNIGAVFINRVHKKRRGRPTLDFAATKKRKEELLAQGKKLFNKEEADWCEANGIEYTGVDYRVYLENEYFYEIVFSKSHLEGIDDFDFSPANYRSARLGSMTNQDIIKECNYDLNKICEVPCDLRTKLTLCDTVDKTLYTNFIRNENQTTYRTAKANRKD